MSGPRSSRQVGEGGDGTVGVRAGVAVLHRAVPLAGQRVRGRYDPLHHLVKDRLRVADPEVLGPGYADDLALRYDGEALPGLVGA